MNAYEQRFDLAARLAAWLVAPRYSPVRAWRWHREVREHARSTGQPVAYVVRDLIVDALELIEDEP